MNTRRIRSALHDRGHHRFCRVSMERPVIDRDFRPQYLKFKRTDGTEASIDVTTFGGSPVYGEPREVHR